MLRGHTGRDIVHGDGGADRQYGYAGRDELYDHEDDLFVDAVLHGGPGFDRAWLDDDDQRTSIEQRLDP